MIRKSPLGTAEFAALIACMYAVLAYSMDAMLPSLPRIAADLSPAMANRAQFVITAFILGMGLGTFLAGPLSDAFGRRRIVLGGLALYTFGAFVAWQAPSLEVMIVGRILQGLGAAGPRVAAIAIVRDRFAGRQMARILSLSLMIFTLVPGVAPVIGEWIALGFGWRAVFFSFFAFAIIASLWFGLRQGETLAPENRRPLNAGALRAALVEVLTHRQVLTCIAAQTLVYGVLFSTLTTSQPIFEHVFGRPADFAYYMGAISLAGGGAALANAALVGRLGMRALILRALFVQSAVSVAAVLLVGFRLLPEPLLFPGYILWKATVFLSIAFIINNLNALALAPMGHIAGMAASVATGTVTISSLVFAVPIGLAFDGSALPLLSAAAVFGIVAFLLMALNAAGMERPARPLTDTGPA